MSGLTDEQQERLDAFLLQAAVVQDSAGLIAALDGMVVYARRKLG